MAIEIDAMCELGTRQSQQDCYLYHRKEDKVLAIVCDGMGGLEHGDKASQYVATTLLEDFKSENWERIDVPTFFRKEVLKLDAQVNQLRDSHGKPINAGTTIVAVILQGNRMYWLTVGDSSIFVLRGNEIVSVNAKHNYKLQLDEMFEQKRISKLVYTSEMKHAHKLISYLGVGNISIWDINDTPLSLRNGDYVLLCTDGITNTIANQSIREIIQNSHTVERSIHKFVEIIRQKKNGQDNATCILMKYMEEGNLYGKR